MPLEEALAESANGDFGLILLAFLIISIVGSFLWMMRRVFEQNAAFNQQILLRMDSIVNGMHEYRNSTCSELQKHDDQAKTILETDKEILTTLKNRPCVAIER
jgi:hypothetical protein